LEIEEVNDLFYPLPVFDLFLGRLGTPPEKGGAGPDVCFIWI